jgi:ribosomal-protein-alanine N-acetyltransferase
VYYNRYLMLTTTRLRLRLWRDEDLPSFAAINSDPRVMQYMAKLLERAESDASAKRIKQHFARHGFGLWAVELIGIADFIGFTGFSVPTFFCHWVILFATTSFTGSLALHRLTPEDEVFASA